MKFVSSHPVRTGSVQLTLVVFEPASVGSVILSGQTKLTSVRRLKTIGGDVNNVAANFQAGGEGHCL